MPTNLKCQYCDHIGKPGDEVVASDHEITMQRIQAVVHCTDLVKCIERQLANRRLRSLVRKW